MKPVVLSVYRADKRRCKAARRSQPGGARHSAKVYCGEEILMTGGRTGFVFESAQFDKMKE